MKTILLATDEESMDRAISEFENYTVLGKASKRIEIVEKCRELNPDILIIAERIAGKESIPEIILEISKEQPTIRVVFLTGSIDFNKENRRTFFTLLVYAGVYDIIHEDKITAQKILSTLDNPRKKQDVQYLVNKNKSKGEGGFVFINEEKNSEEIKDYYSNLYSISSIKPGTGKSFVSTNIATMIAQYGEKKPNGQKPKIALIEADLQNLSLGTLLQIEDDKHNLKTALDKINSIINDKGSLVNDMVQIETVNKHIIDSFKPYLYCNNLYALVGSQLNFEELENVNTMHYMYLVESIIDEFDVVIIDTNSSLAHITTAPLLKISNTCYYILNLDFNNVRNNYRYKNFLKNIGISDKVKYILNENITKSMQDNYYIGDEDLLYDSKMIEKDFILEAKIPLIPKTTFLNSIYNGKPISLDKSSYTLETRYEISKIANEIWPLTNYEELKNEIIKSNSIKRKGLFGRKK